MADVKTTRECMKLVKVIVKKMLSRNDEDVEQEIYIRLWHNYPNYEDRDKLGAWVRTIAENYCRDYLRCKSKQLLSKSPEGDEEFINNMTTGENPERIWLQKCRQKLILEAVNELPKDMKQAIILVEFKDMPYEKAAKKLHINIGTLKSRLHNAKAKLHEKLAYLEL